MSKVRAGSDKFRPGHTREEEARQQLERIAARADAIEGLARDQDAKLKHGDSPYKEPATSPTYKRMSKDALAELYGDAFTKASESQPYTLGGRGKRGKTSVLTKVIKGSPATVSDLNTLLAYLEDDSGPFSFADAKRDDKKKLLYYYQDDRKKRVTFKTLANKLASLKK